MTATSSREVELSLVIAARDPDQVVRRLQRMRKVDEYALRPVEALQIVDHYFDTPDGKLRKGGLALRLRKVKGETTIGLKGPRRRASTRTEDRFEREEPFSTKAIEQLAKRLRMTPRRLGSSLLRGAAPDEILEASLGVKIVQRRETHRYRREVGETGAGAAVAELALDRVLFEIGDVELTHYEVEVEAKRPGRGTRAVRVVTNELLSRYGDVLIPWPYGKLATGKAIESLLVQGRWKRLARNGVLTPRAYEEIRRYLRRSRYS